MDIVEVSRRSGLTASALRYYEKLRLIRSVGRSGLRRVFTADVLERLSLIALGRSAGFSLEEIGRMFGADGRVRIDRRMLAARADELDRTIRRLAALRRGLRHAAACPAPSHLDARLSGDCSPKSARQHSPGQQGPQHHHGDDEPALAPVQRDHRP